MHEAQDLVPSTCHLGMMAYACNPSRTVRSLRPHTKMRIPSRKERESHRTYTGGFRWPSQGHPWCKRYPLPTPAPASNAYFAVLCDGPDHTDSRGDVHDTIFRPRRLHYGPGTSCQSPKKPRQPLSAKILEGKHPTSYYGAVYLLGCSCRFLL